MKRSVGTLAAAVLPLLLFFGGSIADSGPRLQIVLDVSGSMAAEIGGVAKMDAARRAVRSMIAALEERASAAGEGTGGFVTALRLYGHRLPREPKAASCEDTELVIPFQPLDRARFDAVLTSATPRGQTPIARSLEAAAADFGDPGEDPAVVILVSDGEETCGGDPVAVACSLSARGFDMTVHTVGFDVGAEAKRQLEGVAECTGGEYRDAANAEDLGRTLTELSVASFLVDKERETRGGPIRGGDGFADAVPLEPGARYHLDHHQRKNEFDHFHVDVASGQKIVATIQTGAVGADVRGETFRDTALPYAGIAVHAPDETAIASESLVGRRNGTGTVVVGVPEGREGRFYVVVGSQYNHQHMSSPFIVELEDQFDASGERDAGPDEQSAVEIEPGRHAAWLQLGDQEDTYRFEARPGVTYDVEVQPAQEARLSLTLSDAAGRTISRASMARDDAAARIAGFTPDTEGPHYVRASRGSSSTAAREEVEYSLALNAEGGAATAVSTGELEPPVDGTGAATGESGGPGPIVLVIGALAVAILFAGGFLLVKKRSR